MVTIEERYETQRIGTLNASELYELACFVVMKQGHANSSYALTGLIDTARENPDKRVFDYVRERTAKD